MLYLFKKYYINLTIDYIIYSYNNFITIMISLLNLLLDYPLIPLLAIFYIYSKKLLSNYIRDLDKKYDMDSYFYITNKHILKQIFKVYNISMTIFSYYCSSTIYYLIFNELDNYGYSINNYNNLLYDKICYYFFISKYIEYLDTYFIIIKNKPISYLQYIHHLGAPIITGLLYYTQHNSYHLFVLLNGFIHTIMYLYYYITLLGYKINFKYILTTLQIIQFNCGIIGGNLYFLLNDIRYDIKKQTSHFISYYYIIIINILFINFYIKNYIKKRL